MHSKTEQGASAVLITASLLLLLGMAAIAIDVGAGFNERRQAQSAADFAVLAAVAFSNNDSVPVDCDAHPASDSYERALCRGAVEAMAVAQANLPGQTLDWENCEDTEPARAALFPVNPLVELTPGSLTEIDCIGFTASTQGARVVVPQVGVDTSFGRILGINELTTTANAEALSDLIDLFNVIPFGIPANADSSYECVKTGANPNWGACYGGPDTGNFGYMDIPAYGNPSMGTAYDGCNPTNATLISNIVRGVDHPLGTHPNGVASAGNPALQDETGNDAPERLHVCPIFGSNANEILNQTGNVQSAFEQGMTFGYDVSERGRLWLDGDLTIRTAGGTQPPTVIDDTPLWTFLTTYAGGPSAPCPSGGPTVSDTSSMRACLDAWTASDGVIFQSAIRSARRYAFAPRLHDDFTSNSTYLIESIAPIYLQTSYWGCSSGGGGGTAGSCAIIHSPGETGPSSCASVAEGIPPGSEAPDGTCGVPGNINRQINAITAFLFDSRMLPDDARLPSDPSELVSLNLTR